MRTTIFSLLTPLTLSLTFSLTLSFGLSFGSSASALAADSYGKGVTLSQAPIALSEAVKQLKQNDGKEIVVKAKVDKVCQSKGCWLVLKDGDTQVRVTFANYSFFVPKNSASSEAVVQGKLFEKEVSAAEARHYAKDEHMPAKEVAKIQTAQKAPWFEATGLTLSKK